jgi:ADP-heptose:LPS heptosyltransferase
VHRRRVHAHEHPRAMHLAAACQCPLVAIFGYSVVSQWRPWKAPCELINLGAEHQQSEVPAEEIMRRQTPAMVMAAVDRLIRPPVPS